jgi:hypothetical protein
MSEDNEGGVRVQRTVRPVNWVEDLADEVESAFDQPCAYGNRVECHAVYCHSPRHDMPRKCRRTWYTGGEIRDEDCPGFKKNEHA